LAARVSVACHLLSSFEGAVVKPTNQTQSNRRRALYLTGAAAVVVSCAALIVPRARTSAGSPPLELPEVGVEKVLQTVRTHTKQQAFGPGWSQHREIRIPDYLRSVPKAA
jgi:hypothetical protein